MHHWYIVKLINGNNHSSIGIYYYFFDLDTFQEHCVSSTHIQPQYKRTDDTYYHIFE